MKAKVSLAGLVLGAVTAMTVGLLVSHYSFAWLVVGMALGLVMGVSMARRSPTENGLPKGEQR
jgi:FtsH-binding integral membrane protein